MMTCFRVTRFTTTFQFNFTDAGHGRLFFIQYCSRGDVWEPNSVISKASFNQRITKWLKINARLREYSHLPLKDGQIGSWPWHLCDPVYPWIFERRGVNQAGLICPQIGRPFPWQARHCGIYEWRANGTLPHQPRNRVVYVGSKCRAKPGALSGRILEYCANGSHKRVSIIDALGRGYELWVRCRNQY